MPSKKRKTFLICNRCGTSTIHTLRCAIESDVEHYDIEGFRMYEPATYRTFQCDGCTQVSLYIWSALYSPGSEFGEPAYPMKEQELYGVPDAVQLAYRQAEKVRTHSTAAYAVLARRVIEAIARDRGIVEKNLSRAVTIMAARGEIPPLLAEAATLIRTFGNTAAHESGEAINWNHVQMIEKFLVVLIEYLYVGPATLRDFKFILDIGGEDESSSA